jgi:hypothetical protein
MVRAVSRVLTTFDDDLRSAIRWLDGHVQLIVDAPSFSPAEAVQIADLI